MASQELWLDQYASDYHAWQTTTDESGEVCLYRPLGLIERGFDHDGIGYEGRADINAWLELKVASTTHLKQIEERVLLAWSILRLQHPLLMAKADFKKPFMHPAHSAPTRFFYLTPPQTAQAAISQALACATFLNGRYPDLNIINFYHTVQNVARVIKPTEAMAKLFVYYKKEDASYLGRLQLLIVMGHQISDGLTNWTWLHHLLHLVNKPMKQLRHELQRSTRRLMHMDRLPLPQEDLYAHPHESVARQRWYWAIMRVRRHVRRPLPACFQNPLRRRQTLSVAVLPSASTYQDVLDYSKPPLLNTFTVEATIPAQEARKMISLCRQAKASIGAGSFALTAMVMMMIYEKQQPLVPQDQRLPFIGAFPLNPRPFFDHHAEPDGLMLAFSDGVVLPFLPSTLDFASRFRLLVRQAHRQLRQYQKKKSEESTTGDWASPSDVVAQTFLGSFERAARTAQAMSPELQHSLAGNLHNPQGSLPACTNPTPPTCGISSVGKSGWRQGIYNLDQELGQGEDAFVADFRSTKQNVRARDGEFLVGIWGESDGSISANVSADENAICPELAQLWKHCMENVLQQVPDASHL